MSADTTPGAVYVSDDGLVSYAESGRRLDGLGNETWGGYGVWDEAKPRYSKPVQDAINKYTAEVAEYERQMAEFLAAQQPQPQQGMYSPQPGPSWQRNPASDYTTKLDQLRATSSQPGQWSNASNWRTPQTTAQPQPQQPGTPYRVNIPLYQMPAQLPPAAPQPAPMQLQPQGYTFPDYRPTGAPVRTNTPPPPMSQPYQTNTPGMDYLRGLGLPNPSGRTFDPYTSSWR